MDKVNSDTAWTCININCRATNKLGACSNCGGTVFTPAYDPDDPSLSKVVCPNCYQQWYRLKCPKCGSQTPVDKAALQGSSSTCFLAPAVYGSPHVQEIELLRQYRDMYLRRTMFGGFVIRSYEYISPPIAGWVAERPYARKLVRQAIMVPLVKIASQKIARDRT